METLAHYKVTSSKRLRLPGKAPWPFKLFTYKRCLLETRIKAGDNELIIYNVHLAFFDRKEKRRQAQLQFIKQLILNEYHKGNYIILGGDWNLRLPGVDDSRFGPWTTSQSIRELFKDFHTQWTPEGWHWALDRTVPIVRTTNEPYQKGRNYTTIFDGFLLSPNIELLSVKGWDMDFNHSDHQPVSIEVKLKRF